MFGKVRLWWNVISDLVDSLVQTRTIAYHGYILINIPKRLKAGCQNAIGCDYGYDGLSLHALSSCHIEFFHLEVDDVESSGDCVEK
jgi:hypothetical protein